MDDLSESQGSMEDLVIEFDFPSETQSAFPGGSKKRVNRAGDRIRQGVATAEDIHAIDVWRAAHRAILNTFQAILRNRTRGTGITVAQRHKRRRTIYDKLRRYPKMQLSRMDDTAGCRLIFSDKNSLYAFREKFHVAKFNHIRKNETDKYDYIKHPKISGYRGIHDVYEYNVRSKTGKYLAGLYVEIQYRTLVQHAWATAVEVVGFVTTSQPKFQKGDLRYQQAMAYASEIFARAFEEERGPFPGMTHRSVVQEFIRLDRELKLLKTLRGLKSADQAFLSKKNAILIFSSSGDLETRTYRYSEDALRSLFILEKRFPDRDIVLVRADTSEDVRLAFRNYFSDAIDFLQLVSDGCEALANIKPKI